MDRDDVLATWFWWHAPTARGFDDGSAKRDWGGSYAMREVDDVLRRVAAELDAGRPAGPLIRSASFTPGSGSARYEASAVDWFLEQFLITAGPFGGAGASPDAWPDLPLVNLIIRPDPGGIPARPGSLSRRGRRRRQEETRRCLAVECARAWRDFDQLPGTRLRWHWQEIPSAGRLLDAEEQIIASYSYHFSWRRWAAGGRTFATKKPDPQLDPLVDELAAAETRDHVGHFAAARDDRTTKTADSRPSPVADEAGTTALYLSGSNFAYRQSARITFPDRRWLRFWVRGTSRRNAIMTAVDQTGNKVIRYRRRDTAPYSGLLDPAPGPRLPFSLSRTDIAVHPDLMLTEELVLAIAVSAQWLSTYFEHPK